MRHSVSEVGGRDRSPRSGTETPRTEEPAMSVMSRVAGCPVHWAARAESGGTTQAPRRLGLALAVIATAQLMVVLDATIVNVALPHIQRALGFSGTNLEWVVNAYTLVFGGLLLLGGRSGDLLEWGRRTGRSDIPGAVTGTLGVAAMVYGLSSAAPSPNGVSHWTDTKVVASLTAAVALLAAFGVIEAHSKHALLPMRLLGNRNRSGAYLISLCVGTAMFGMFFFLTIFMQTVWGYSALKTGIAYLPMIGIVLVTSAAASQLISRTSALPMLAAGGVIATGGMVWLARVREHSTSAGRILRPSDT